MGALMRWLGSTQGRTHHSDRSLYLRVGILVRPVPDENVSDVHFVLLGCEVQGCESTLQREREGGYRGEDALIICNIPS